eukprot:1149085-Pelagomonas_calceolata.AAC.2
MASVLLSPSALDGNVRKDGAHCLFAPLVRFDVCMHAFPARQMIQPDKWYSSEIIKRGAGKDGNLSKLPSHSVCRAMN